MKKLVSFIAIAFFLSIPLAANADTVGLAYMDISANGSKPNVPYLVYYYGNITSNPSFPHYTGTQGIFCISAEGATDGLFQFNTITSNGPYIAANGSLVTAITADQVSEVAWVADNWQSYSTDRAMAQLAIWAILGIGTPANWIDLSANSAAKTMATLAGGQTDYVTSKWYAAFDTQDYLVPKPVPEPGILILLGIAMSAIGVASWKIRKL